MINRNELLEILNPENRFNNSDNYQKIFSLIEQTLKDQEKSCKEFFIDSVFFNYEKETFEIEIYDLSDNDDVELWEEEPICEKSYSLDVIVKMLNEKHDINIENKTQIKS